MIGRLQSQLSYRFGVETTRMYLYRLDAGGGRNADQPKDLAGIEWSLLRPAEAAELAEVSEADPREARFRMLRGDQCYVARIEGRMAHHSWVQTTGRHPITEAGIERAVQPGEFWIYHCHTVEWARGRRLYPTALARIVREHFAKGYRTAWIYTQEHNTASQKAIERMQFVKSTVLRALRMGRHFWPLGA